MVINSMHFVMLFRLWYINVAEEDRQNSVPTEVGYMNVIPKCIDWTGKYPVYESLPETYAAIDAYLSETPLEGVYRTTLLSRTTFKPIKKIYC